MTATPLPLDLPDSRAGRHHGLTDPQVQALLRGLRDQLHVIRQCHATVLASLEALGLVQRHGFRHRAVLTRNGELAATDAAAEIAAAQRTRERVAADTDRRLL